MTDHATTTATETPAQRRMRRLGLLRDAVVRQSDELLDMSVYGWVGECGTTYCAAGCYAANNPAEGLTLSFSTGGAANLLDERGRGCGPESLSDHFSVTFGEANGLFFGEFAGAPEALRDVTKAQVLEQIDAVIARYAAAEGATTQTPTPGS